MAERLTRADLVERLEMEAYTGMPPGRQRKSELLTRSALAQLVELCREALGE